jgi:hypothetical protein
MLIKQHSTHNEYIRAGDMWVRNFAKFGVPPLALDHLFEDHEYDLILANEVMNKNYTRISRDTLSLTEAIIVSDGYGFNWKHLCIAKLPAPVFAVNRALRNWKLMTPELSSNERRSINAYITNNPYQECMGYLPTSKNPYYPACIASTRTNYAFLKKWLGDKYVYEPPPDPKFGAERQESYCIDDYRNPICAAIGLLHQFGVQKLMLISCDDSFAPERDFAVPLPNGLWTYPQQIRSHEVIDANLYWLTHQEEREVQVADWSDGPKYVNATYINSEEEAIEFFAEEGN